MTEAQVSSLLTRLANDGAFLSQVRENPGNALQSLPLSLATLQSIVANRPGQLRALTCLSDELGIYNGPTVGPRCTQAGCFTQEARCTSDYACSKTGRC